MFEYLFLCFSPADNGGGDDQGADDVTDQSDVNDNGGDTGGTDTGSDDSVARKAFASRQQKRDYKTQERLSSLEEKLTMLTSRIEDFMEDAPEKTKAGRPPKDESKLLGVVESLNDQIKGLKTDFSSRFDKIEAANAEERAAAERRDLLGALGATPDFIRKVDQGIVVIPDEILNDYDRTKTLVGELGGIKPPVATSSGTSTQSQTDTRSRSVPHRDDSAGTGTVHADKQQHMGIDETITAAEKGIDDLLEKQEGVPDVNDLTKIIELTEKIDDALDKAGGSV